MKPIFGVVRLESLRIKNFKNIANGKIFFQEHNMLSRGEIPGDVDGGMVGIYGQNGSGKTSCLEALRVIQWVFSGAPLFPDTKSFIKAGNESLSIEADFWIKRESNDYYVEYSIEIGQAQRGIKILKEKLSYSEVGGDKNKLNAYSFISPQKVNTTFLNRFESRDKVIYQYSVDTFSSADSNNGVAFSTIFNINLLKLLLKQKNKDDTYISLLNDLRFFASNRMAIYSINYFNENANVGIRFRVHEEGIEAPDQVTLGDVFVPFNLKCELTKTNFEVFKRTIDMINKVIPSIIPRYQVEIVNISKQNVIVLAKEQDIVTFELMSNRDGKHIPLLFESNGIKKLISILSGLIEVFNTEGSLMVIDELDSGVFEYLLGEIAYAFDNFSSGQIIFTSHNMRILEKLNYKEIFFSTTDPENAFIQFKGIKSNNNLRDTYYKYIANKSGSGQELYDMVKTEDIISAFSIAGGN